MATFGGLTFVLIATKPGFSQQGTVSVRHIPGGNTSYVDVAGRELPSMSGRVHLTTLADFTTLRGLVGTSGTLVYSEGSFAAVLIGVSRDRVMPSGRQIVDVEFVLTVA